MSRAFGIRPYEDGAEVVVTGPWAVEARELFQRGEAHRLVLNYALGFDEESLEFLEGLPIRDLVVLDRRLTDLSPIYSLTGLEGLEVTTDAGLELDLSRLTSLVSLGADWAQVRGSIEQAKSLSHLFLRNYGAVDLSPLVGLRELNDLSLKDRPHIRSLAGLSELPAMRRLGIFSASRLEDLSELWGRSDIEELELESCRRLADIDFLSECRGLITLNLSECGDLASVDPLKNLTLLQFLLLYGSTRIVDGDLRPIAGLPNLQRLQMQSRRSYTPSVAEIQASLPRG